MDKAARLALPVLAFLFLTCLPAFADDGWYSSSGSSFVDVVENIRTGIGRILKIILLIGSAGALAFAVYNMMEGEPQGAKRFMIWMVGLLIGFVFIHVLGTMATPSGTGSAAKAGSFSELKYTVKNILMILLAIVAMVTVIQKVFQLINGEKEGGRQLFKWFSVSTAGFAILSVI